MQRVAVTVLSISILGFLLVMSGCRQQAEPLKLNSRKVVNSIQGEVVEDVRYLGDTLRFKVYYRNEGKHPIDVLIRDQADRKLTEVTVFNKGEYDAVSGQVSWNIKNVQPGLGGFVEFKAKVENTGEINNRAELEFHAYRQMNGSKRAPNQTLKTNAVTVKIVKPPKLGWISFGSDVKPSRPEVVLKDENSSGILVNFVIPGMYVDELKVKGTLFHRLNIAGGVSSCDIGTPEVPMLRQVIEVPVGVNFKIEISKKETITLYGYTIYPAQETLREHRESKSKKSQFEISKTRYQANQFYPGEPAVIKVDDIGVSRGHRILIMKVNPLQYNPVTHTLKAYSNLEIRIQYDRHAQTLQRDDRILASPNIS